MKKFKEQLENYAKEYQQSGANRLLPYVSIPLVVLGVLIFLTWFSLSIVGEWHVTFAWIAVILLFFHYFRLHVKLAIAMTAVLAIATLLCTWIAYPAPNAFNGILFLMCFIGGLILQFSGQPLVKDKLLSAAAFAQLLIAPMYWLTEVIKLLKIEKYFDFEDKQKDQHFDDVPPASKK